MEKVRYFPEKGTVIYKTKLVKGLNRDFGIYDPRDFLAAVTAHIPDRREHMVRYYGWYSSVRRGKRRKTGLERPGLDSIEVVEDQTAGKGTNRSWARLNPDSEVKEPATVDSYRDTALSGDLAIYPRDPTSDFGLILIKN